MKLIGGCRNSVGRHVCLMEDTLARFVIPRAIVRARNDKA